MDPFLKQDLPNFEDTRGFKCTACPLTSDWVDHEASVGHEALAEPSLCSEH